MKNNNQLVLISGTANPPLAEKIAKYLHTPLCKTEISTFKDGEVYARIDESVRGKDIFIIQPTSRDVNHNLMELAILIDALKRASAKRITAVIPYYGYARQDRKAKPREPISAKLVANLIAAAGAHRVLTVDLHADQIQGFFDIPLDHLSAVSLLGDYFKEKKFKKEETVVVAPDAGGARRARKLASELNASIAIIDKRRDTPNVVGEMRIVGEVKGKNCLLIDDMIDTGGTIVESAKALKKEGAKEIYVSASHAIFSDPALKRLQDEAIKEVVITDTILQEKLPEKIKTISIAPLLGEAIKLIHQDVALDDVTALYGKQQIKLTDF